MIQLDITHLLTRDYIHMGPIAQQVEQRTFNPWVDGSIPSGPTQDIAIYDQVQEESNYKLFEL